MGMIRPGLREGHGHPGNYRDELQNAALSPSYKEMITESDMS